MALQIEVSFQGSSLLRAAREQLDANRLANQIKQEQAKTEKKGKDIMRSARADKGASGEGERNDNPYIPPTPKEEIAATGGTRLPIAYCAVGYNSFSSQANKIYIWPKKARQPEEFTTSVGFDLQTVMSVVTGQPYEGPSLTWERNPPFGDSAYSDGFSTAIAWSPPLPEDNYLGGRTSCSSNSSPADIGYGGQWTRSVFKETTIGGDFSVDTTIFLPIGNESGILVVRKWEVRNIYLYYSREDAIAQVFVYWTFTNAQGNENHYLGTSFDQTFSYSVTPYNYENFFFQCYLVGPSSVREISAPSGLAQTMEQWNPFPDYTSQTYDLNDPNLPNTDIFYGVETSGTCTGGQGTHGDGYVSTSSSVPKPYTSRVYNSPDTINLAGARLRVNYGFNFTAMGEESPSIIINQSSPVLYDFVQDPDAMDVDSQPDNALYTYIREAYPVTARLKTFITPKVRTISSGTKDSYKIELLQSVTPPENVFTPIKSKPVSRPTWFVSPVNSQNEEDLGVNWSHYLAWDWSDPGYCRGKALEIGFTESDLKINPLS